MKSDRHELDRSGARRINEGARTSLLFAILVGTSLLSLVGCTETVLSSRPVGNVGTERNTAGPGLTAQEMRERIEALEKANEVQATRSEQLYRVLSARLTLLEALSAYQSMGLKILARSDMRDASEERRLFSELARLGSETQRELEAAKEALKGILSELPPQSMLANEVRDWLAQAERDPRVDARGAHGTGSPDLEPRMR